MKQLHGPYSGRSEDPYLGFGYFVRFAMEQTAFGGVACLGAGLSVTAVFGIASVFVSYRFEPMLVWKVIGFFLVLYVPVLWFCTICVGCLIMIPVEIWRFSQRRAQTDLKTTAPDGVLWDRLLDGHERP